MTAIRELDTVVLIHDLPDIGLCAGDIGAVVQLYPADAVEVEFVTASGRTQALLTLRSEDVRAVRDDDLLAVRSARRQGAAQRCLLLTGEVDARFARALTDRPQQKLALYGKRRISAR